MGRSVLDGLEKALHPKCLSCGLKDAKVLKKIQGTIAPGSPVFCTVTCASDYGFRMARERLLQWCPRHQEWHNEIAREQCSEEQALRLKDPRIPLE